MERPYCGEELCENWKRSQHSWGEVSAWLSLHYSRPCRKCKGWSFIPKKSALKLLEQSSDTTGFMFMFVSYNFLLFEEWAKEREEKL